MALMENEQTAVEWFSEQIEQYILNFGPIPFHKLNHLKQQAKQMEKERHDKWNEFLNAEKTLGVSDVKTIERIQWYYNQYFKETYEK